MSTDWRSLAAELAAELERCRPLAEVPDCLARARAALAANADGPAVQSREPASVACEPSDGDLLQLMPDQFRADLGTVSRMAAHGAGPDIKPGLFRVSLNTGALEYARAVLARWGRPAPAPAEGEMATDDNDENWQWYTYCPEEGIELYPNRQQAKSAAQSIMGSCEVAAHSDGWHEDMELVSWGMLVPVEHAQVVARGPADPGGEFDEWVRYELRASRPAPAPAGELLKEAAWLRNECSAGNADGNWISMSIDQALDLASLLERQAAPVPVPVSERLPGPEDCLDEGWAWFFSPRVGWRQAVLPVSAAYTHWLPATALPLPSGEVEA